VSWKGLKVETLLDARIFFADDDGFIHIPYRLADGSTFRTRLVGLDGQRLWFDDGEGQLLYGLERLPFFEKEMPILVTEGETDALCAREHGYQALGAPGAKSFRREGSFRWEWRETFEPFDLVYAIGDVDEAGVEFVWDVHRVVPWARPVVLPEGRDLRDLLQAGDERQLRDLLDEADRLAVTEWAVLSSSSLEEAIEKLGDAA
jgi:DNA primase